MTILVSGISLFVFAFVFHVLVWRLRLPAKQNLVLLILFSVVGVIFCFWTKSPAIEILYILLLYGTLAICYILSYTVIASESPTFLILLTVRKHKQNGARLDDFKKHISNEKFVTPKVEAMLVDNFAQIVNGKYKITAGGKSTLWPFMFLRKIFGKGAGG